MEDAAKEKDEPIIKVTFQKKTNKEERKTYLGFTLKLKLQLLPLIRNFRGQKQQISRMGVVKLKRRLPSTVVQAIVLTFYECYIFLKLHIFFYLLH